MQFLKMEALGNDFVVIEGPAPDPGQVRAWCDRRRGIGADGVLVISRPGRSGAAARMSLWNSDGSVAESCGNGLRCVARYMFDRGWTDGPAFTVETPTGPSDVEVMADGSVRAELGTYRIGGSVTASGYRFVAASVGNPHAVTFMDEPSGVDCLDLGEIGPLMQDHPAFPEGVNVEFAAPLEPGVFRVRVWERGAGETRACGTGAAAVAAVAHAQGRAGPVVEIRYPGGSLGVEVAGETAWIRGPAESVFAGTIPA